MYVKMGLTDGAHGTTEKIAKTISCLVDRTFWVRQGCRAQNVSGLRPGQCSVGGKGQCGSRQPHEGTDQEWMYFSTGPVEMCCALRPVSTQMEDMSVNSICLLNCQEHFGNN